MSFHRVADISTAQAETSRQIKFPDPNPRSTGQWVYHPGPGELPMTFQIGALGDQGVVLGSDKRLTDELGEVRTTFDTPKIKIFNDLPLAYCYAGDALAEYAAKQIVSAVRRESENNRSRISENPKFWLQGLLQDAVADIWSGDYRANAQSKGNPLNGGTILFVYRGDTVEGVVLWRITVGECPFVFPVDTRYAVSGDRTSTALFLMERYYPKTGKPSIETLNKMVAECILLASAVNPVAVNGLELLVCSPDGFTHLSADNDKAPFIQGAMQLDKIIAESLGLDYRRVVEDIWANR